MEKLFSRKNKLLTGILIVILTLCSCSTQPETKTEDPTQAPSASVTAAPPAEDPSPAAKQRDIEGTKRVWMNVFNLSDLVDTTKWDYVSKNIDTVSVSIEYLNQTDVDVARQFADMLKRTGIKLSVGCAGIADWFADKYVPGTDTLGRLSAQFEIKELSRLKKAGKDVDYVVFDHPITRAMYPNEDYTKPPRMTYDEAAEQLAYAMKYWKQVYPEVKFIYCVNFPNHGWKGGKAYYKLADTYGRGDFFTELKAVLKAAESKGVSFYGLVADNPYDYAAGRRYSDQKKTVANTDWMERIIDLENTVKSEGLEFGLLFNSETPGNEGPEGQYYKETLSYIKDYISKGGQPDIYSIESWYKYPLEYIPQSEKYSMTYLTEDVIKLVKFGEQPDLKNIDMSEKTPAVNTEIIDSWQFNGKVDGWVNSLDIEDMYSNGEAVYLKCSGEDPYIYSKDYLGLSAGIYKKLHIRIKNMTNSSLLQVFFSTNSDPGFDEKKSYFTSIPAKAGSYTDVFIDLSKNSYWSGTIRRLRVDPGNTPGEVYIDFISLEK
jgi:hypothetical protein